MSGSRCRPSSPVVTGKTGKFGESGAQRITCSHLYRLDCQSVVRPRVLSHFGDLRVFLLFHFFSPFFRAVLLWPLVLFSFLISAGGVFFVPSLSFFDIMIIISPLIGFGGVDFPPTVRSGRPRSLVIDGNIDEPCAAQFNCTGRDNGIGTNGSALKSPMIPARRNFSADSAHWFTSGHQCKIPNSTQERKRRNISSVESRQRIAQKDQIVPRTCEWIWEAQLRPKVDDHEKRTKSRPNSQTADGDTLNLRVAEESCVSGFYYWKRVKEGENLPTDQNLYSAQVRSPQVRLRVRHAAWNVLHYHRFANFVGTTGSLLASLGQSFSTSFHGIAFKMYSLNALCTQPLKQMDFLSNTQASFSDVKADQFIPCEVKAVT